MNVQIAIFLDNFHGHLKHDIELWVIAITAYISTMTINKHMSTTIHAEIQMQRNLEKNCL